MAEKIVIAEIDVDVEALLKNTSDLKKALDDAKKAQSDLKKSGDTSSKGYVKLQADIKNLSKAYNNNVKAISDNTQAVADLAANEELLNEALKQEAKSIEEARAQNALLIKLRNQTNISTKEGKKQIKELNKKINENNDVIKENADNLLKQKLNIGNYEEAVRFLNPQIASLIEQLKKVGAALIIKQSAMDAGAKSTGKFSKALKTFRLALINTGIGAIVIAIGALVGAFASTQKGIDKVNTALAPIKGAFEGIIGVVQKIATSVFGSLGDRFTKIKNGILNGIDRIRVAWNRITFDNKEAEEIQARINKRLEESAKASERIAKRNKEVSDTWKNASKDINAAAEAQQRIVALGIEIEKAENDLIVRRAKLNNIIKEQNKIAEDTTKSVEERRKATINSIDASKELVKAEQKILDLKIEQKTLDNSKNDTSRKDEKELAELQAQRLEKSTQGLELQTTQVNKLNAINKQAETDAINRAKKIAQEKINGLQQAFEKEKENRRFEKDTLEKQREFAKIEQNILDEKLRNKLISQTEYDTETRRIQNDLIQKQIDDAAAEEERTKGFEEKKRELLQQNALRDEADRDEKARLKIEQDFENHVRELEQLNLTETEKTELLKLLTEEREFAINEIRINAQQQFLDSYTALSEKEIAERQKNADRAANIASQLTGILTGLLGDSLAAQLAAIALDAGVQAGLVAINTASSQAQNLAKAVALGPPFNLKAIPVALGQNAAMAANSKAAIGKILAGAAIKGIGALASKKKMAKGGFVEIGGKPHSQGGTKFYGEDGSAFEAEKGEGIAVVDKKKYKSVLSELNGFSGFGNFAAQSSGLGTDNGALIMPSQRNTTNNYTTHNNKGLTADEVQEIVQRTISNMPNPVVTVEDINTGQESYTRVVEGANLG
jgi:hypothetical protein